MVGDIASGAGLIVVGFGVSYLMSLSFKILAARYLGAVNFGVFSVGGAIVSLAGLGVAGADRAVARLLPRNERDAIKRAIIRDGAKVVLVTGIGLGVAVFAMSGWIADVLTNQVSNPAVIRVFAVAVPATVAMKFSIGATRGLKWTTPKVVVQRIAIPGVKLVLGTVAALMGLGSMGFAWAYTGAMILGGGIGLAFLLYSIPAAAGKAYDYGKKAILRAALPLMVVTGANVVYTSIDTLMVGYFDATGEVGIYRASWMVSRVTLVPLLAMAFLAMPTLSELHSKGDMKGVNKIYSLTVKWISLASLPVLTAFVSFPGLIMTTIFGEEYASGAAVLIILSSGFFTHCVMGNNEGLMISVGGEKRLMGISVVALFMNIVLNISLIPKFGGGGAAIATAFTFMLMNILMSFCLYRYHGIRIGLRYTSARIMWLFAPAIVTYFVSTAHVTGSSLFSVLVAAIFAYAYLVLRLAVTEPEEKRVALHGARLIGVEGILKRIV